MFRNLDFLDQADSPLAQLGHFDLGGIMGGRQLAALPGAISSPNEAITVAITAELSPQQMLLKVTLLRRLAESINTAVAAAKNNMNNKDNDSNSDKKNNNNNHLNNNNQDDDDGDATAPAAAAATAAASASRSVQHHPLTLAEIGRFCNELVLSSPAAYLESEFPVVDVLPAVYASTNLAILHILDAFDDTLLLANKNNNSEKPQPQQQQRQTQADDVDENDVNETNVDAHVAASILKAGGASSAAELSAAFAQVLKLIVLTGSTEDHMHLPGMALRDDLQRNIARLVGLGGFCDPECLYYAVAAVAACERQGIPRLVAGGRQGDQPVHQLGSIVASGLASAWPPLWEMFHLETIGSTPAPSSANPTPQSSPTHNSSASRGRTNNNNNNNNNEVDSKTSPVKKAANGGAAAAAKTNNEDDAASASAMTGPSRVTIFSGEALSVLEQLASTSLGVSHIAQQRQQQQQQQQANSDAQNGDWQEESSSSSASMPPISNNRSGERFGIAARNTHAKLLLSVGRQRPDPANEQARRDARFIARARLLAVTLIDPSAERESQAQVLNSTQGAFFRQLGDVLTHFGEHCRARDEFVVDLLDAWSRLAPAYQSSHPGVKPIEVVLEHLGENVTATDNNNNNNNNNSDTFESNFNRMRLALSAMQVAASLILSRGGGVGRGLNAGAQTALIQKLLRVVTQHPSLITCKAVRCFASQVSDDGSGSGGILHGLRIHDGAGRFARAVEAGLVGALCSVVKKLAGDASAPDLSALPGRHTTPVASALGLIGLATLHSQNAEANPAQFLLDEAAVMSSTVLRMLQLPSLRSSPAALPSSASDSPSVSSGSFCCAKRATFFIQATAACAVFVNHNIRDMVPALNERGYLRAVFDSLRTCPPAEYHWCAVHAIPLIGAFAVHALVKDLVLENADVIVGLVDVLRRDSHLRGDNRWSRDLFELVRTVPELREKMCTAIVRVLSELTADAGAENDDQDNATTAATTTATTTTSDVTTFVQPLFAWCSFLGSGLQAVTNHGHQQHHFFMQQPRPQQREQPPEIALLASHGIGIRIKVALARLLSLRGPATTASATNARASASSSSSPSSTLFARPPAPNQNQLQLSELVTNALLESSLPTSPTTTATATAGAAADQQQQQYNLERILTFVSRIQGELNGRREPSGGRPYHQELASVLLALEPAEFQQAWSAIQEHVQQALTAVRAALPKRSVCSSSSSTTTTSRVAASGSLVPSRSSAAAAAVAANNNNDDDDSGTIAAVTTTTTATTTTRAASVAADRREEDGLDTCPIDERTNSVLVFVLEVCLAMREGPRGIDAVSQARERIVQQLLGVFFEVNSAVRHPIMPSNRPPLHIGGPRGAGAGGIGAFSRGGVGQQAATGADQQQQQRLQQQQQRVSVAAQSTFLVRVSQLLCPDGSNGGPSLDHLTPPRGHQDLIDFLNSRNANRGGDFTNHSLRLIFEQLPGLIEDNRSKLRQAQFSVRTAATILSNAAASSAGGQGPAPSNVQFLTSDDTLAKTLDSLLELDRRTPGGRIRETEMFTDIICYGFEALRSLSNMNRFARSERRRWCARAVCKLLDSAFLETYLDTCPNLDRYALELLSNLMRDMSSFDNVPELSATGDLSSVSLEQHQSVSRRHDFGSVFEFTSHPRAGRDGGGAAARGAGAGDNSDDSGIQTPRNNNNNNNHNSAMAMLGGGQRVPAANTPIGALVGEGWSELQASIALEETMFDVDQARVWLERHADLTNRSDASIQRRRNVVAAAYSSSSGSRFAGGGGGGGGTGSTGPSPAKAGPGSSSTTTPQLDPAAAMRIKITQWMLRVLRSSRFQLYQRLESPPPVSEPQLQPQQTTADVSSSSPFVPDVITVWTEDLSKIHSPACRGINSMTTNMSDRMTVLSHLIDELHRDPFENVDALQQIASMFCCAPGGSAMRAAVARDTPLIAFVMQLLRRTLTSSAAAVSAKPFVGVAVDEGGGIPAGRPLAAGPSPRRISALREMCLSFLSVFSVSGVTSIANPAFSSAARREDQRTCDFFTRGFCWNGNRCLLPHAEPNRRAPQGAAVGALVLDRHEQAFIKDLNELLSRKNSNSNNPASDAAAAAAACGSISSSVLTTLPVFSPFVYPPVGVCGVTLLDGVSLLPADVAVPVLLAMTRELEEVPLREREALTRFEQHEQESEEAAAKSGTASNNNNKKQRKMLLLAKKRAFQLDTAKHLVRIINYALSIVNPLATTALHNTQRLIRAENSGIDLRKILSAMARLPIGEKFGRFMKLMLEDSESIERRVVQSMKRAVDTIMADEAAKKVAPPMFGELSAEQVGKILAAREKNRSRATPTTAAATTTATGGMSKRESSDLMLSASETAAAAGTTEARAEGNKASSSSLLSSQLEVYKDVAVDLVEFMYEMEPCRLQLPILFERVYLRNCTVLQRDNITRVAIVAPKHDLRHHHHHHQQHGSSSSAATTATTAAARSFSQDDAATAAGAASTMPVVDVPAICDELLLQLLNVNGSKPTCEAEAAAESFFDMPTFGSAICHMLDVPRGGAATVARHIPGIVAKILSVESSAIGLHQKALVSLFSLLCSSPRFVQRTVGELISATERAFHTGRYATVTRSCDIIALVVAKQSMSSSSKRLGESRIMHELAAKSVGRVLLNIVSSAPPEHVVARTAPQQLCSPVSVSADATAANLLPPLGANTINNAGNSSSSSSNSNKSSSPQQVTQDYIKAVEHILELLSSHAETPVPPAQQEKSATVTPAVKSTSLSGEKDAASGNNNNNNNNHHVDPFYLGSPILHSTSGGGGGSVATAAAAIAHLIDDIDAAVAEDNEDEDEENEDDDDGEDEDGESSSDNGNSDDDEILGGDGSGSPSGGAAGRAALAEEANIDTIDDINDIVQFFVGDDSGDGGLGDETDMIMSGLQHIRVLHGEGAHAAGGGGSDSFMEQLLQTQGLRSHLFGRGARALDDPRRNGARSVLQPPDSLLGELVMLSTRTENLLQLEAPVPQAAAVAAITEAASGRAPQRMDEALLALFGAATPVAAATTNATTAASSNAASPDTTSGGINATAAAAATTVAQPPQQPAAPIPAPAAQNETTQDGGADQEQQQQQQQQEPPSPAQQQQQQQEEEVDEGPDDLQTDGAMPWDGALDPLFLGELPVDMRREILRENFAIIRTARYRRVSVHGPTHNNNNRNNEDDRQQQQQQPAAAAAAAAAAPAAVARTVRTRVHPTFMNLVPAEVQADILEIEGDVDEREARQAAAANRDSAAATRGGQQQPAAGGAATAAAAANGGGAADDESPAAFLNSLPADLRADVLRTMDLNQLRNEPELRAEAMRLRNPPQAAVGVPPLPPHHAHAHAAAGGGGAGAGGDQDGAMRLFANLFAGGGGAGGGAGGGGGGGPIALPVGGARRGGGRVGDRMHDLMMFGGGAPDRGMAPPGGIGGGGGGGILGRPVRTRRDLSARHSAGRTDPAPPNDKMQQCQSPILAPGRTHIGEASVAAVADAVLPYFMLGRGVPNWVGKLLDTLIFDPPTALAVMRALCRAVASPLSATECSLLRINTPPHLLGGVYVGAPKPVGVVASVLGLFNSIIKSNWILRTMCLRLVSAEASYMSGPFHIAIQEATKKQQQQQQKQVSEDNDSGDQKKSVTAAAAAAAAAEQHDEEDDECAYPPPTEAELAAAERNPLLMIISATERYLAEPDLQPHLLSIFAALLTTMDKLSAPDEQVPRDPHPNPPGYDALPEFRHERHRHTLRWRDAIRSDTRYQEGKVYCNVCMLEYDTMGWQCSQCTYDLCPHCAADEAPLAEQEQRGIRFMQALFATAFPEKLLNMLSIRCAAQLGDTIVAWIDRGVDATLGTGSCDPRNRKHKKQNNNNNNGNGNGNGDGKKDAVVVSGMGHGVGAHHGRGGQVDAPWILDAERQLIACAKSVARSVDTALKIYKAEPTAQQLARGDVALLPPETATRLLSQLGSNADTLVPSTLLPLLVIHAKRAAPQGIELRRMWLSVSAYMVEVERVLGACTARNSITLPSCVVPLIKAFSEYHLSTADAQLQSREISYSGAMAVQRSETELLVGEANEMSAVSEAALAKLKQTSQAPTPLPEMLLRFLEKHRNVINACLYWQPALLDQSFKFLTQAPRLVDFEFKMREFRNKVLLLRRQAHQLAQQHAHLQQLHHRHQGGDMTQLELSLKRDNAFAESFNVIRARPPETLLGPIHVRFRDEEGADAGGLTREWFQIIGEEIVNPNYALFVPSSEGTTFQPNPLSDVNPDHLLYFRFVGRMIGLALVHDVPLDVHLTRAVYRHMVGIEPGLVDIAAVDPGLAKSLEQVLTMNLDEVDLCQYFSITVQRFGAMEEVELMPGGADIAVTNENKKDYVRKRCKMRMTTLIEKQLAELLLGFYELVPRHLVAPFSEHELELLICGMPDVDIEDLRVHTEYQGYTASSPHIRWFWAIVSGMSQQDKANLLQFVTGCSKVPPGGFANLAGMSGNKAQFCIARVDASPESLPVSHTCFNRLDLNANYPSCEVMRQKLMTAITLGNKGFALV